MTQRDIIIAIATAQGNGGIAILRLSGQGALQMADLFFKSRAPLANTAPRTLKLGNIADSNEEVIDQVLAAHFQERHSYTGEESVEIHCHGGKVAAASILELFLQKGARLADPGEFTKRAFLNGRIDLLQAESVMGIIHAKSQAALSAAGRVLSGEFGRRIRALLDGVNWLAAELEVSLDFPEEDEGGHAPLAEQVQQKRLDLEALLAQCRQGALLQCGIRVALLGRPNVGKSSLLNALIGEDKAIVTPHAGTTRDRVEGSTLYQGMELTFVDSAGIRETEDPVEKIGVERARELFSTANLCLLVLDASRPITEEDQALLPLLSANRGLLVLNKQDLTQETDKTLVAALLPSTPILEISAATGSGIEKLKEAIVKELGADSSVEAAYSASRQQLVSLEKAQQHLLETERLLSLPTPHFDACASALHFARESLASILGVHAEDELIDLIFSEFCVGK